MTTAVSNPRNEPLVPAVATPPRRRRRWVRVVVLVVLAIVAAWLWLVSPLARALVVDRLHAAGFADVDVAELRIGFGTVHASQLRLGTEGGGQVVIPEVTAEYTLGGVFAGRLQSLTLDGPQWVMAAASAASPFDQVMRSDHEAGEAPVTALPALPVGRMTIRNGHIAPGSGRAVPLITFDGEIVADDAHWNVTLRASGGGQGVQATAQLDVSPGRANGPVTLRAAGERPLELHGTFGASVAGGARVFDVELRRDAAPFDVHVGDMKCTGDGAFAVRARVPMADLAAAAFDVSMDDVSVETSNGFTVAGLATKTKLAGLPVPASAGAQQVTWRSAQLAMLKVGEGKAGVDVQQGMQLLARVEQKTSDGTGTIVFRDLLYELGAGSIPAHVEFDRVPLQEWLEALSKGRITGEGRLSGNVDLILRWAPRLDVELQGGHVTSEGGIVHFLDDEETKGMIQAHVEQIAEAAGHGNIVKERLVGALQEFAYHTLDFRLEPEPDGQGVTLRVHTAGKGRIVPQELDLTVNLHGFDAALDTALALKLGLDRAKQRLDDKIDSKNEPKPRDEQR